MRETPPYRAIPCRDSIAEGGVASICLVFIGYRASIAEIPLLRGGVSHLHFTCSPREKMLRKGGGCIAPNFRKILVSVKLFVRNSGAGNGCANFMGTWKNALLLQEKPMSIKCLLLGGGWKGGGSADFIFVGARIFLTIGHVETKKP